MSDNNLKTTFVFSSVNTKTVITQMLKDEASITHRSLSGCMEEHMLFSPIMPDNRDAEAWLVMLNTGKWTMAKTLSSCFSYLAAGPNGYDSRATNALAPLCNFCRVYLEENKFPKIDESAVNYLVSQADTVATILERASKDGEHSADYEIEAKHIRRLCETLQTNSTAFSPLDVFETLGAYHIVLAGNSRTYRLLSAICSHVSIENNERSRYEFAQLLREICKGWG